GQPSRCRKRLASGLRAGLCAAGAPPRVAPGIRLRAAGELGGAPRRCACDRAPRHASARAFLADPLRQRARSGARFRLRHSVILSFQGTRGAAAALFREVLFQTSAEAHMARQSKAQRDTMERVMHEYKRGELKRRGGRRVKSRRQAVAIGLRESGSSKYQSRSQNKRALRKTKSKERHGETAMQEREGRGSMRR